MQLQSFLLSNFVFSSHSLSYRLKFQLNPTLKYLYPPPSNGILTNITHALMSVPKFYVQVSICCCFSIVIFSTQYLHVFDVQIICVYVFVFLYLFTPSVYSYFSFFGKWEFVQKCKCDSISSLQIQIVKWKYDSGISVPEVFELHPTS